MPADDRDPRDVFTKDLDVPRSHERGPVREHERLYEINAPKAGCATIGGLRVVSESDLHDGGGDTRKGLRHL